METICPEFILRATEV